MLLRLAYLGITNTFAMLRLLPRSDRDEDIEILTLRHQIRVLQRQLGGTRVRFAAADRAFLKLPEPTVTSKGLSAASRLPKTSSALVKPLIDASRSRDRRSTRRMTGVLLRLAYLNVTNTFAMLRLLPSSDKDRTY